MDRPQPRAPVSRPPAVVCERNDAPDFATEVSTAWEPQEDEPPRSEQIRTALLRCPPRSDPERGRLPSGVALPFQAARDLRGRQPRRFPSKQRDAAGAGASSVPRPQFSHHLVRRDQLHRARSDLFDALLDFLGPGSLYLGGILVSVLAGQALVHARAICSRSSAGSCSAPSSNSSQAVGTTVAMCAPLQRCASIYACSFPSVQSEMALAGSGSAICPARDEIRPEWCLLRQEMGVGWSRRVSRLLSSSCGINSFHLPPT